MQKLKLDLGELEVQSFPTAESPAGGEGTVHGMIVSTDQVPHCQDPNMAAYNLGMESAFGCPGLFADTGDQACGIPGIDVFQAGQLDYQGGGA